MAQLSDLVRPGYRVALADGVGSPRSVSGELSDVAAAAGSVSLLLGWTPVADPLLRFDVFADVRTLMSGWGLRPAIDAGQVHAPPVRLSTVPALLHGPLRPDVLVTSVVPHVDGGYVFATEVSWLRAAVDAGARVAGVLATAFPRCDPGPALPADRVTIIGESGAAPVAVVSSAPGEAHRLIAAQVARLIPDGARLQVGPGPLGAAVLDAIERPVRIDSGLLPEGIVGLAGRGLLVGEPIGAYLAGGPALCGWADGRPVLRRLEYTHDITRLSTGVPFVAVNMALEIDEQGQVNVEGVPASALGLIGGHPDYAVAGARSVGGLSIVAVPTHHRGVPTLRERLSMPVSTPGHDVDVIVTERGSADLRGLDRPERRAAIRGLWD